MKKSLLSVVLCVAVLLTAVSAMFVMPANAADDVDLLAGVEGGVLTITDGNEVVLNVNGGTIADQHYIDLAITSDVAFEIKFVDANGNQCGAASDFCYDFSADSTTEGGVVPGTYDFKLKILGAWTYNNWDQSAALTTVKVQPKAAGNLVISKLVQTDGIVSVDVTSASYAENADWAATSMLNTDSAAWGSADANGTDADGNPYTSSAVVAAAGNGVSVSASSGLWPAATLNFAEPVVANWATDAIYVNYTISQTSRIILFYGASTVENWDSEEYVDLTSAELNGQDLGAGKYTGTIMLSDIIPETSVAADGTVNLNSLKVFAIGTGTCVTIDAVDLLAVAEEEPSTTTTEEVTTTTEAPTTTEEPTTTTTEAVVDDAVVTITVETVTATETIAAGETVEVDITISEFADLSGFMFRVAYDSDVLSFPTANTDIEDLLYDDDEANDPYVLGKKSSRLSMVELNVEPLDAYFDAPMKELTIGAMSTRNVSYAEGDVILTLRFTALTDITEGTAILLSDTDDKSAVTWTNPDDSNDSVQYSLSEMGFVSGGVVIEKETTTTTEAPTTTTTEAPTTTTTEAVVVPTTTTTEAPATTTTEAPADVTTTTEAPADVTTTTEAPADVTTTTTAPSTQSPVTGDSSNAILFVVVALLAAGAVVLTVASKKVASR